MASTLYNLGDLYLATQRMKEAETTYIETLATDRELAKENPAAYLPNVASTLYNLGRLYATTQRMKEAESAFSEGIVICRELVKVNPATTEWLRFCAAAPRSWRRRPCERNS